MKVIDGWLSEVDDDDQVVEFMLSVALHDVLARAKGSPRPPGGGLTRVWEGSFVIVPARQPRRSGRAPARRSSADRRPQPPVMDGIPYRDRLVAEGVAELLMEWAGSHNAG